MIMAYGIFYSVVWLWLLSSQSVHALIAYDCGHMNMAYARVGLHGVEECNLPVSTTVSKTSKIQLLELVDTQAVEVMSCKVEVNQVIYKCGPSSGIYAVTGGVASYIYRVGERKCKEALNTGRLTIFDETPKPLNFHDIEPGKSYKKHTH